MYKFRFLANYDISAERWILGDPSEIKHLTKVLKLGAGDQVELADGCGYAAVATISELDKNSVSFTSVTTKFEPQSKRRLSVALGALKHGDLDELIAPLCELGVGRIEIFLQDKMDKSRISEKALSRWRGICRAALKQSKAAWLCEVTTYKSLAAMQQTIAPEASILHLLPGAANTLLDVELPEQELYIVVGSESGFSPSEEQLLVDDPRSHACNLGRLILRAKTAAIVAPGLISQRLHKLN